MKYTLRSYQQKASDAAVSYFARNYGKVIRNGIIVLPTGAGKSLVVADIASRIDEPLIVLQPSKEILEQNVAKYASYGYNDYGVYSASVGMREIRRVTFATIGSIINHLEEFNDFHKIIVDECHLVKPYGGQYNKFFKAAPRKVIGLTATPYRLTSVQLPPKFGYIPQYGSMLQFLTRSRPRVFSDVLYYCQVSELVEKGYLARLRYFNLNRIDLNNVKVNTTGADYDEKSLFDEMERVDFYNYLCEMIERVLHPKNGVPRNGILVFTKFVNEAERLAWDFDGICEMVSGETPKKEREAILERFKSGKTKIVANVGVLTTGFDHPALDTIILARPTMSLAQYYQMIGRAIRPYNGKDGWVVDLCGSYTKFGKVEDLKIDEQERGKYVITNNGVQLTNVVMTR